jgi:hypothetical protein
MNENGPRTHSPIPYSRHQKRRRRTATRPPFLRRVKNLLFRAALSSEIRAEDYPPQRDAAAAICIWPPRLGGCTSYFLEFPLYTVVDLDLLHRHPIQNCRIPSLVRKERNGE